MNRICIETSTGRLLEFQGGNAPLGTLVKNAVAAGYKKSEVEEKYTDDDLQTIRLKYEMPEEKNAREEKAKLIAINVAKKIISDKYKGKKKSAITDADAIELMKLKVAQELGLEL